MDANDREILDNFKSMTVGQIFIKARQSQDLHIGQIAQHLNISTPHLEAIEHDDKAALPPKVYAVGFVRAYADVLGLDSEKMVYLFKLQFYGLQKSAAQQVVQHSKAEDVGLVQKITDIVRDHLAVIVILMLLIGVITGIGWVLWWLFFAESVDGDGRIPPVPTEMTALSEVDLLANQPEFELDVVTPEVTEPMQLIVKPEEGAASYGAEPLTSALAFKTTEKSWIEIVPVDGGKPLLSKTLKAGDVFYTPADKDILVTTGNAAGVDVYLDGQKLGPLGKADEIIRLRPFSVKALRLQLKQ